MRLGKISGVWCIQCRWWQTRPGRLRPIELGHGANGKSLSNSTFTSLFFLIFCRKMSMTSTMYAALNVVPLKTTLVWILLAAVKKMRTVCLFLLAWTCDFTGPVAPFGTHIFECLLVSGVWRLITVLWIITVLSSQAMECRCMAAMKRLHSHTLCCCWPSVNNFHTFGQLF